MMAFRGHVKRRRENILGARGKKLVFSDFRAIAVIMPGAGSMTAFTGGAIFKVLLLATQSDLITVAALLGFINMIPARFPLVFDEAVTATFLPRCICR